MLPRQIAAIGGPSQSTSRTQGRFARPAIAAALVLAGVGLAAPRAAVASPAGQNLLQACRSRHASYTLSYSEVAADPASFGDATFLVRGRVTGSVEIGSETTYLLDTGGSGQVSLHGKGLDSALDGPEMLALAHVPHGWAPGTELDLIASAPVYEAGAVLQEINKIANRRPTRRRAATREYYLNSPTVSRSGAGASDRRELLQRYADAVLYFNPRLDREDALTMAGHVIWYSNAYGVDARLVMAVIAVESEFETNCTSNRGAMGLAQLMPGTARDLGVMNPYDPEQNIAGAVRLMRQHLLQNANTNDPLALALACYNAGENAVKKYHGVPPYRETRAYVQKVKELYAAMCR